MTATTRRSKLRIKEVVAEGGIGAIDFMRRAAEGLSQPILLAVPLWRRQADRRRSGQRRVEYRKVVLAWDNARPPSESAKEAKAWVARLR